VAVIITSTAVCGGNLQDDPHEPGSRKGSVELRLYVRDVPAGVSLERVLTETAAAVERMREVTL
jgi:hypothetical protein